MSGMVSNASISVWNQEVEAKLLIDERDAEFEPQSIPTGAV